MQGVNSPLWALHLVAGSEMGQKSQCLPAKAVFSQGKPDAVHLQCFQLLRLSATPKDHGATCLPHDLKQDCHWGGGSEERHSHDSPQPASDLKHHLSPHVNSRIYFNPSAGLDPSTLCLQYLLLTNQQGVFLGALSFAVLCRVPHTAWPTRAAASAGTSREQPGCILHCQTWVPATAQQLSLLL